MATVSAAAIEKLISSRMVSVCAGPEIVLLIFSNRIMRHLVPCVFNILLFCLLNVTPVQAASRNLLILGDSLSAAYGIPVDSGWVALLQERLGQRGHDVQVYNASISGETTGGALARLPGILERLTPDITLIELGANDGLRGFPPDVIRDNLLNLVTRLRQTGSAVVLVQMHLPPNYGQAYNRRFDDIYRDIAAQNDLPLAPFILQHMYDDPELMQDDGLHPRAVAQPLILNHIWPVLAPLLEHERSDEVL